MIVHVEYTRLKKLKEIFSVIYKKYGARLTEYYLHFQGKAPLKPYVFLHKKLGQITYRLPAKYLTKQLVSLCNHGRIDLRLFVDGKLSKRTKSLLARFTRAIAVDVVVADEDTQTFLNTQNHLLVCKNTQNRAFEADLFNLVINRQTQYQCKCSSCLSSVLYITENEEVCFCPWHAEASKMCDLHFDGDYFDNAKFLSVMETQIETREKCKSSCKYYPYCRGGCAMTDVCDDFKREFPKQIEKVNACLTAATPLHSLPLHEAESILRGVSQGIVKQSPSQKKN